MGQSGPFPAPSLPVLLGLLPPRFSGVAWRGPLGICVAGRLLATHGSPGFVSVGHVWAGCRVFRCLSISFFYWVFDYWVLVLIRVSGVGNDLGGGKDYRLFVFQHRLGKKEKAVLWVA